MGEGRILVVDDDLVTSRFIVRTLEEAGYGCTAAANADEARDQLSADGFQAVICDVIMPGETGFSLVAYIRRSHPDTPVIVMTSVADSSLAKRTVELGAICCIPKPFEAEEMLDQVRRVLANGEPLQEP